MTNRDELKEDILAFLRAYGTTGEKDVSNVFRKRAGGARGVYRLLLELEREGLVVCGFRRWGLGVAPCWSAVRGEGAPEGGA